MLRHQYHANAHAALTGEPLASHSVSAASKSRGEEGVAHTGQLRHVVEGAALAPPSGAPRGILRKDSSE